MSTDYARSERITAAANASGDENALLTVAIPPDRSVGETLERVEERHAEAAYLDADETSSARRAVLDRVQHLLHGYDETPANGLVLHVGAVAGQDDVAEYVFDDLPGPVPEATFEWSNEFDVEVVETVARSPASYGLLVVERGGAALGHLDGDRVETIETIESDVMGKTKAGGQSADRFERDRARQKAAFFDEVAAEAKRAFVGGDEVTVDGLLLGGTTVTVDEFVGSDALDHRLRDATVGGTFSVEYASEQGLRKLVERGREAMNEAEFDSVRSSLERFREALRRTAHGDDGAPSGERPGGSDGGGGSDEAGGSDGDEVVYGADAVDRALAYDAVETVLVSDDRPAEVIREYDARTDGEGGDLVVVPADTETGARFAETFGVAAILRFPID